MEATIEPGVEVSTNPDLSSKHKDIVTIQDMQLEAFRPRSARYNCIVLDLDESLVHSCGTNLGGGISFSLSEGERKQEYWAHKRPGFDIFLKTCFKFSKVGVWSAGKKEYVDAIVELFPEKPLFVYNRDNCPLENGIRVKKLDNIPYRGSIVMIDDRSDVLKKTDRVDTIVIPPWHPTLSSDSVLYNLFPLLFDNRETHRCKPAKSTSYLTHRPIKTFVSNSSLNPSTDSSAPRCFKKTSDCVPDGDVEDVSIHPSLDDESTDDETPDNIDIHGTDVDDSGDINMERDMGKDIDVVREENKKMDQRLNLG